MINHRLLMLLRYSHCFSLLVFLMSVTLSCKTKYEVTVKDTSYRLELPPGMSQIGENLFMDVIELQNTDYLFYIFWDYGREHHIPEQEHWPYYKDSNYYNTELRSPRDQMVFWPNCFETYWSHPKHLGDPVIGVSYKNAQKFTQWRESRILERLLIEKKLIDRDSINKYPITLQELIDGKVKLKPSSLKWIAIPKLSLPRKQDFERALLAEDETYFASHWRKRKNRKQVQYVKIYPEDLCYGLIDINCSSYKQFNNYAVYNLSGCVDEYVRQEVDLMEEELPLRFNGLDFVPTDKEGHINTGFRNVAEYIIIELPIKENPDTEQTNKVK